MGLIEESDWIASWIEPDREEDPQERHPAPFFRHEFALDGKVAASLNHYAYGVVGSFLYEYVAGIRPLEPGFRRVEVRPHPGGGLTYARSSHISPYGRIASSWWIKGGNFELEVEIPGGVSADIILPDGSTEQKGPGKHRFEQARAG